MLAIMLPLQSLSDMSPPLDRICQAAANMFLTYAADVVDMLSVWLPSLLVDSRAMLVCALCMLKCHVLETFSAKQC